MKLPGIEADRASRSSPVFRERPATHSRKGYHSKNPDPLGKATPTRESGAIGGGDRAQSWDCSDAARRLLCFSQHLHERGPYTRHIRNPNAPAIIIPTTTARPYTIGSLAGEPSGPTLCGKGSCGVGSNLPPHPGSRLRITVSVTVAYRVSVHPTISDPSGEQHRPTVRARTAVDPPAVAHLNG